MMRDSLPYRCCNLLNIKVFLEWIATKEWTLGCTWFVVAVYSPVR